MSLTTTLPFPFSCAGSGCALSAEEGKVIGNRKRHLFHHDNGITMAREVETAQRDQGHVSDCLSGVSD